jgi:hypothetical protein
MELADGFIAGLLFFSKDDYANHYAASADGVE